MKKSKIVLTSALAILTSASLIVGASYALFTSETNVDITVTSGKVEVTSKYVENSLKLYSMDTLMPATNFTNGGSASISDHGDKLTVTNITPGDKVTFEISVENLSNVAIKYKVNLNSLEDNGLASGLVINVAGSDGWNDVAPSAAIDNVLVSVELPSDSTNEFQNKSTTYAIVVNAVQGNANV